MPKKTEMRQTIMRGTNPAGVAPTRKCHEEIRTGTSSGTLKHAILDNLYHVQARIPDLATRNDCYEMNETLVL